MNRIAAMSEEELVLQAQRGNNDALERLLYMYAALFATVDKNTF